MNFCCNVNDLFEFYDFVISTKPKADDFIDLNESKKMKQDEFDFEIYSKKAEEVKEQIQKNETTNKQFYSKDRIHELMFKYKYDTITDRELNEFYKSIEKLIYKIVRKNYVSDNFNDICNEIWRRIAKYKHKWDENKKVCVSTWIGKLAINVINTLREKSITYKSHHVSCDGYFIYGKNGEAKEIDMDVLANHNRDTRGERINEFYENIYECFDKLNDMEKKIVLLCIEKNPEALTLDNENRTYRRRYASASFIKKKLNLTSNEYKKYIKSIGEKYVG